MHGITSEQHESGFYTQLADKLLESGIPSLRFNWRCHGGNPLEQSQMTLTGIVNDIHAAYESILARALTPSGKVFVVAASFGGGAAVNWASRQSCERVAGAALLAPVIDYAADLFRQGELDDDLFLTEESSKVLAENGVLPTSSLPVGRALINELPFFDCVAAVRDAEYPISFFHGGADSDVPLDSSRKYSSTNPHARLEVVPGVDHGFVVPGSGFTDGINARTHNRVTDMIHDLIMRSRDAPGVAL